VCHRARALISTLEQMWDTPTLVVEGKERITEFSVRRLASVVIRNEEAKNKPALMQRGCSSNQ